MSTLRNSLEKLPRWGLLLGLYLVALLVFGLQACDRWDKQSIAPHFVVQADQWLDGKIALDSRLRDDTVVLERFTKPDGSTVLGRRMGPPYGHPEFRGKVDIVGSGPQPMGDLRSTGEREYYMSFPAFPVVVFLPQAAISGPGANDVITTVLLAALALPLLFLLLEKMREARYTRLDRLDALCVAAAFCFGSVYFFSAVQGSVWFTAHVIGVVLTLVYLLASIGAKRPVLAGIALAFAATTRTPMAFLFIIFAYESYRVSRANGQTPLKLWAQFAAPIVVVAVLAMWYNYVRFASPLEFGHRYLEVQQQAQMEKYGLFDFEYLVRNIKVALLLYPEFGRDDSWVKISGHGLALWITMPYLFWVFALGPLATKLTALIRKDHPPRPATRSFHLTAVCVVTALVVAVPTLFYQNTGWFQFGYRFSLDYLLILVFLWAGRATRITIPTLMLIVAAIAINWFGAATFNRPGKVYDYNSYKSIFVTPEQPQKR